MSSQIPIVLPLISCRRLFFSGRTLAGVIAVGLGDHGYHRRPHNTFAQDADQWGAGNAPMGSPARTRASPCRDDQWGCGCLFVSARWLEDFDRSPSSPRLQEAPPGSPALTGRPSHGAQAVDYASHLLSCCEAFLLGKSHCNVINQTAARDKSAPWSPAGWASSSTSSSSSTWSSRWVEREGERGALLFADNSSKHLNMIFRAKNAHSWPSLVDFFPEFVDIVCSLSIFSDTSVTPWMSLARKEARRPVLLWSLMFL